MSPLISTRRAEEFATAVDGHVPARHADVQAFVELVAAIRAVEPPPLSDDFVAQLRGDLLAAPEWDLITGLTLGAPARRPGQPGNPRATALGRRLAVAASAFVVAGGGVGLVATSASALPGTILYPVKRATERVDLLLHTDAGDDARILLEHADTRLDEVDGLLSADTPTAERDRLFRQTLNDFTQEATQGGDILIDSYQQTGLTADMEDLRSFTTAAADRLVLLAPVLPASSSQAFADAAAAVGALDERAVTLCPACRNGQPVVDPAIAVLAGTERLLGARPLSVRKDVSVDDPASRTNTGSDSSGQHSQGGSGTQPDVLPPPTDLPSVGSDPTGGATDGTDVAPEVPDSTATEGGLSEVVEELLPGDGPGSTSSSGSTSGGDSTASPGVPDVEVTVVTPSLPIPLPVDGLGTQ